VKVAPTGTGAFGPAVVELFCADPGLALAVIGRPSLPGSGHAVPVSAARQQEGQCGGGDEEGHVRPRDYHETGDEACPRGGAADRRVEDGSDHRDAAGDRKLLRGG
jgi:hypothetical protein